MLIFSVPRMQLLCISSLDRTITVWMLTLSTTRTEPLLLCDNCSKTSSLTWEHILTVLYTSKRYMGTHKMVLGSPPSLQITITLTIAKQTSKQELRSDHTVLIATIFTVIIMYKFIIYRFKEENCSLNKMKDNINVFAKKTVLPKSLKVNIYNLIFILSS